MSGGTRERRTTIIAKNGKFERDALAGDDVRDLTSIDTQNGKRDVFQFDYWTWRVESLSIHAKDIKGKSKDMLQVNLSDKNFSYALKLFLDSNVARDILKRIENLPPEPVQFNIGADDKGSFLWIESSLGRVEKKYNKDNAHGLPQWEKRTINNEVIWDKSAALVFWKSKIPVFNTLLNPEKAAS
jgi:hypothetical protein